MFKNKRFINTSVNYLTTRQYIFFTLTKWWLRMQTAALSTPIWQCGIKTQVNYWLGFLIWPQLRICIQGKIKTYISVLSSFSSISAIHRMIFITVWKRYRKLLCNHTCWVTQCNLVRNCDPLIKTLVFKREVISNTTADCCKHLTF